MSNFRLIAAGIDVAAVNAQLAALPADAWDEHRERQDAPGTPHSATSDVWLRFRAPGELTSPAAYGEAHFAEFYPAWWQLPALHAILFRLMPLEHATYLGGTMITRLPAGASIAPHRDVGTWHADALDRKVYLMLQSNPGCINWCGGESFYARPGDAFTFPTSTEHAVENRGETDRLVVIACCSTR